jgi:uncharacterized peroxidase-related enzyme
MAHIFIPEGIPGIVGPMVMYPETEKPLNALAEALLRGESSLTPAERELIATYTSRKNDCTFCASVHGATARHLYGEEGGVVDQACENIETAPLSDKMRALLTIAGKVQGGGLNVSADDVARARSFGADDKAIHDTVLIAAAFCMFNRYVDGLATWAPEDPAAYAQMGAQLAENGYLNSIPREAPMGEG